MNSSKKYVKFLYSGSFLPSYISPLTDIHMLLTVEKGTIGEICHHAVHQYATASNKYMKDHDKNKESLYLKCWNVNNLYGWEMSQRLLVNGFSYVENTSKFSKGSIKNYSGDIF